MNASLFRSLWIIGSAASAGLGSIWAMLLFPDAIAGRNPIGQFGWYVAGFAATIAIPVSLAQWLILQAMPGLPKGGRSRLFLLWLPATALGILAMLLPLWWIEVEELVFVPFASWGPALPGVCILAVGQFLALMAIGLTRPAWIVATTLGLSAGMILGLVASVLLSVMLATLKGATFVWFEALDYFGFTDWVWATVAAATMAGCQSFLLPFSSKEDMG